MCVCVFRWEFCFVFSFLFCILILRFNCSCVRVCVCVAGMRQRIHCNMIYKWLELLPLTFIINNIKKTETAAPHYVIRNSIIGPFGWLCSLFYRCHLIIAKFMYANLFCCQLFYLPKKKEISVIHKQMGSSAKRWWQRHRGKNGAHIHEAIYTQIKPFSYQQVSANMGIN